MTFVYLKVKLRTASSLKEEEEADHQEVPRETDDDNVFVNDK